MLVGSYSLIPTVNSQVFVVGVLPDACLWKCLVRVRVVCCFWLLAGAMAKKRPAASRAGADTDSQRHKIQGPEHAEVAAAQAVRYNTPYDQLLTCLDSGATMTRLRAFRAFQEFSVADLQKMCVEGATGVFRQRCYFVASDEAVKDLYTCLVHFIAARECLRRPDFALLGQQLRGAWTEARYARQLSFLCMWPAVKSLRLCNIQSRHDRHSYRMRFIASALLGLVAARTQLRHHSIPALVLAALFSVLTGGLAMCRLLKEKLAACAFEVPEWCASMILAHDVPMVWSGSRGRPRRGPAVLPAEEEEVAEFVAEGSGDLIPDVDLDPDSRRSCEAVSNLFCQAMQELGLQLLEETRGLRHWHEVSHSGFRPFSCLGFPRAAAMWKDLVQKNGRACVGGILLRPCAGFPAAGLGTRVLYDRVSELLEPWYSVSDFQQRSGGTCRAVALLSQRTMLIGSDAYPCSFPPQCLHSILSRVQLRVRREQAKLPVHLRGLLDIELTHSDLSSILCCWTKVLEHMLGGRTHAEY